MATEDKDWEEEEESKDDEGDEDDGYLLEERRSNPRLCDPNISHQPAHHVGSSVSALNKLI